MFEGPMSVLRPRKNVFRAPLWLSTGLQIFQPTSLLLQLDVLNWDKWAITNGSQFKQTILEDLTEVAYMQFFTYHFSEVLVYAEPRKK